VASFLSHAGAAFGLGAALGAAPGPVQVLLLSESARGGARRGLRAMLGANLTFGVLLVALSAGLSLFAPAGAALRTLEIVGGAFLLFIAADAFRAARVRPPVDVAPRGGLAPAHRGVLAVLVNPGAWIFLATSASAFFAEATRTGGRSFALGTAAAMLAGIAAIDGSTVLLAATGRKRLEERALRWVGMTLAGVLATLGVALVVRGAR
jgi:threonine/homoserine/homoserine lactone efflux protein